MLILRYLYPSVNPGCGPSSRTYDVIYSQGSFLSPRLALGRKSTTSDAGLHTHTEGALTGISLRDHLGSHLLPELIQPDTGQCPGLRTFRKLLHRPVTLNQLDLMSLELLSLCDLPSPSTGPKCWGHLSIL